MDLYRYALSVPVSVLVSVIMLICYTTCRLHCDRGFLNQCASVFKHGSVLHLLTSLLLVLAVSRFEYRIGSAQYLMLFVLLVLMTSFIEHRMRENPNAPCNFGISGVLFGLVVLESIYERRMSCTTAIAVLLVLVGRNCFSRNMSLSGQVIGVLSGAALAAVLPFLGRPIRESAPYFQNLQLTDPFDGALGTKPHANMRYR